MVSVTESIKYIFSNSYSDSLALDVLSLIAILTVISFFIWYFYKSISKKDIIELNLKEYNQTEHPIWNKIFAIFLYMVEYILIMPILIILWFAALSVVLFFLATETSVNDLLLIAAALIGSIRILAYFHSEISKDLAKLFPFITLAVFLLSIKNFNLSTIFTKIKEIPSFFDNLFSFFLVIFVMEIVIRLVYAIVIFWQSEEIENQILNHQK